jgi:hypothetical protein
MRLDPLFQQTTRRKHTFRIALLISVAIHGAVLFLVNFDRPDRVIATAVPNLDVVLVTAEKVEEPPVEEVASIASPVPQGVQETPKESEGEVELPETAEEAAPIDFLALISIYAEEATAARLDAERHRAAMWRKTFSVMFAPPDENWLIEDEPYLPDLQFEADKAKVLGIKISENCYLGLPGIDPQSVDSDGPGWSGGGALQPPVSLMSCGFGE